MPRGFTESIVEDAALAWLEGLGYIIEHGPAIAPGELAAERQDYGQVVLDDRLRQALARLNPDLPAEATEDAFRKVMRPEGATLEARNRALHRPRVVDDDDRVPPVCRQTRHRRGRDSRRPGAGAGAGCLVGRAV